MKITKALTITLIFAAAGLLTALLTIYVHRNVFNAFQHSLTHARLGDNIKNRVAEANSKFDELLSGNNSINYEKDVVGTFSSAQQVLQGAYEGRETTLGKFEKPTDIETQAILKEAAITIDRLTAAANDRWAAHLATQNMADSLRSVTSTSPNQRFFTEYESFKVTLDRLIIHLSKKMNSETSSMNAALWGISLLVFLNVSLLTFWIYRMQAKSDKLVTENNAKLKEETLRVETLTQFIEAVSSGNYNIELNTGKADDGLTNTLVTMRDKLKTNAEEDRRRNWSTSGLAQIGEILRANSSLSELYDNIIKFIVKYTKSSQGGLFLLNDENENSKHLELVACYAFERKKFLTRQIELGDGLVGQCYLEGERIYLLDVPQEYISITSGLGGANPNSLLIVPMKVNDITYGVIELASFNKYEEFEIELVEKLAETIASTISNVRVNETTRLLLERTQQQTEEMKSQEEEIRQNMEELEATQEEMRRKQTIVEEELEQSKQQADILRKKEAKLVESQNTLQAIVDNLPRAIFWKDRDLKFMGCNLIFAKVAGLKSPHELIGKSDFDMAWSAQADAYRKDDLEVIYKRKPKLDIEEVNINSDGMESWVLTSKVPVINDMGEVIAILGMFEDITIKKRKEADIARKLAERETALKELTALKQLIETRKI